MCLTAKNFGLQEKNINISKPQGRTTIIRKTGLGTTVRERGIWTETERKREGGCSAKVM